MRPLCCTLLASALGALLFISPIVSRAQTTIEIGNGTILNNTFQPPSTYANSQPGSRNQMLFLASELQAAGMGAGFISSIGFNVAEPSGTTLQGFGMSMGTTVVTALSGTWETGLTLVWGPQDFTDQMGWTMHEFVTPYEWDGVSNLVIESCYYNGISSQNARVYQTSTPNTSWVTRLTPNPTVCSDPGGTHVPWQQRPNIRFQWTSLDAPPVAMPVASPLYSCTGTIQFSDQSSSFTDTWQWDFGDGGTSGAQSTEYTYVASGTYTVTLIATNAFGADTVTLAVTVDLSGVVPVSACNAPSAGDVAGFGIFNVVVEGVPHLSNDALTEGYLDNTCQTTTVLQGTLLDLSVTTGTVAGHAVRAWMDWDNSGTFTSNELILTGSGPNITVATVVPASAVLNIPLRLRVVATYDLVTPVPPSCGTVQYGQAEDYSITVLENTQPPVASMSAAPLFSCDGVVQFTDHSLNTPTAWAWDFGDGGSSDEEDPMHSYTVSGTYTVSLTAINANGQDDTVIVAMVTVDLASQLTAAACTPATQSYCCGYGILGFAFAGITSASADGSEGYRDRSCGNVAQVEEGLSYPWSVTTGDEAPHDLRIWIDMDNSGSFTANELVATALDLVSPSGTVMIPAGSVFDVPVRVRVQADVIGQSVGPCDAPLYGQVEDYSVVIAQNTALPVAAFTGTPQVTCDGVVQFADQSTNLPNQWLWNFGDGSTSDEQDPLHTFPAIGLYTVTLTATNNFGNNSHTQTNYINYVPAWQCDTFAVNVQQDQTTNACQGVLADDGGPNGNYQQGSSGAYTIAPAGAVTVALTFSEFQWGNNQSRHLAIYDGPNLGSPLIGQYNGNGLGQLPNNGFIVSTGPTITLRQVQQGGGNPNTGAGFLLSWNCSLTGIDEFHTDRILGLRPVPAGDWFDLDLTPDPGNDRRLLIVNVTGQVVHQELVSSMATYLRVDSSKLPSGLYSVQLVSANDRSSRKLIIQ